MSTYQGPSIQLAAQDASRATASRLPSSKAAEDTLQQALRPLYDKACVLALAVANGQLTERMGWASLYLAPSSREILDRLCSAGCRLTCRGDGDQPPGRRRDCRCAASYYLRMTWVRELRRWPEARAALQQVLRRRLAPALERSANAAEITAICNATDPWRILTDAEHNVIVAEECAWWTRCHTRLNDMRTHAR